VRIFVIPTGEELVMTEDTRALIQGAYHVHTSFTYSFQSRNHVNKAREEMLKAELAEKKELTEVIARPR
jgi:acetate kinase